MKALFLDSNLFLQCRELTQIPWGDISEGEDILLLIPRAVQEEIDRLKQDGNNRRSNRARKANTFIRQIILSEDTCLFLKESAPRVQISFPPPKTTVADAHSILDLSRPDDQIIAEAIAYQADHPDWEVAILTHDTNPILTARRCNVQYIVIPENWLLPPEPNTKDKRIAELERKLKEIEKTYPNIEMSSTDMNSQRLDSLSISIVKYSELSDPQLEDLLSKVKSKYPMVTEFDESQNQSHLSPRHSIGAAALGLKYKYEPPTEEEICEYKQEKYPKWLESVRSFFKSLPSFLEHPHRLASFSISIANTGAVPAESVVVEFSLSSGLLFAPPDDDTKKSEEASSPRIPSPPRAPEGRWIQQRTAFSAMLDDRRFEPFRYTDLLRPNMAFQPPSRDRHAFYWKFDRPGAPQDSWTFECEEFRHRVDPELFDMTIEVPDEINVEKAALKCLITAKNLPEPCDFTLPIRMIYTQGDILVEAQSLL